MFDQDTRILLVEDNPGDARLIREMVADAGSAGFDIVWVSKLSAGLERLGHGEIDLVLLDLGLPDSRGLETFFQAYAQAPDIPFVVLTGLDDETLALKAVRQGAQDYLVKGATDAVTLLRAIRYATERKRVQVALRRAHDDLEVRVDERTAELVLANQQLIDEITKRKETEAALQASEDRYRAIFENTGSATIIVGPDRTIHLANSEFAKMSGYPQGEIEGQKTIEAFLAPEDVQKVREFHRLHCVASSPGPSNYEFRFKTRQGWLREVLLTVSLVPGTQNSVASLLDITARKQAERALKLAHDTLELKVAMRTAELAKINEDLRLEVEERQKAVAEKESERQRLFALLEVLPATVYVKAPDYSIRFANRKFREMFGETEGNHCYEAVFGREEPCGACSQSEVIRTGQSYRRDWTTPDGSGTYQVHDYPFADADGSPLVLTLGIDVTERKHVEEALRQSEEKYRTIVETAQEGIWLIGPDDQTAYVNERMAELLGYSVPEMLGRNLLEFMDDDERSRAARYLAARRQGVREVHEVRRLRKDGATLWCLVSANPLYDVAGRYIGALGMYTDITQRKKVEEELQRQRQELQIILDSVPAMIFFKDQENRFVRINKAMVAAVGLPKDEIEGKTAFEIFPSQAAAYWQDDQEVISTGIPKRNIPELMESPRGTRWLQTDKLPYRDEQGKIIGVIGFAVDITERRQAEEALRQSEARLAEAQRIARLGNWEWDRQTNQVAWSYEFFRILNLNPVEFSPSHASFLDCVHPGDRERVQQAVAAAFSGATPFSLVHRIIRPDGSVRSVQSEFAVTLDDSGQARRLLGTIQDITERLEAEERLRESEERFRAIYESTAIGISVSDLEGRIITVNPAFQRMMGGAAVELTGKTFMEITHPDDLERNLELFRDLMAGDLEQYQIEKRFHRHNGAYFWGRTTVSSVRGPGGKPRYNIAMIEDITKRKVAEEQLRHSEQNLRYLATQLLNAQETERKRIALDLHDDLGQALLVLKLQLRAIEKGLPAALADLRTEMAAEIDYIDGIVENVRRLARDLRPTILEDLGLAAALKRLLKDFGSRHDIEFSLDLDDLTTALSPEAQINIFRVFQESLTNIAKYAQASRVAVTAKKHRGKISFTVEDNGRGFDVAQVRAGDPAKRGLGLAAMEERLRMLGGSLDINSRDGRGTRITFAVPARQK
jgi:PAS domain S-box-containing protein